MRRNRFLGVLLCYNDGDILSDVIDHLLENAHDVIVWNHGSTDETASILQRRRRDLIEVTDISREVDFYDMYPLMSKHLLSRYVKRYDWISWPDQDEILEAPTRATSSQESGGPEERLALVTGLESVGVGDVEAAVVLA